MWLAFRQSSSLVVMDNSTWIPKERMTIPDLKQVLRILGATPLPGSTRTSLALLVQTIYAQIMAPLLLAVADAAAPAVPGLAAVPEELEEEEEAEVADGNIGLIVTVIYQPCFHGGVCVDCAKNYFLSTSKQCPICRKVIY